MVPHCESVIRSRRFRRRPCNNRRIKHRIRIDRKRKMKLFPAPYHHIMRDMNHKYMLFFCTQFHTSNDIIVHMIAAASLVVLRTVVSYHYQKESCISCLHHSSTYEGRREQEGSSHFDEQVKPGFTTTNRSQSIPGP